jgi:YD repeat-containing protein
VDVVDSIKVPDGRSYTFTYTPWGSLDTVTEPGGTVRRYVYGDATNTEYAENTLPLVNQVQRAIPCGELWSGEMKKVQARGVKSELVFPLGTGTAETTSISYERMQLNGCDVDTIGAAKAGSDACTQVWKVITYPDLSKKRIGTATRSLNFFPNRPPANSGPLSSHGWEIGTEVLTPGDTLISSSYSGNKETGEIYHEFEIIPTIRMNAKAIGDRRPTKVKNSKDGLVSAVTYAYGDVIDIDPASTTTTNRNTANITRKCVWSGNAEDCDNGTSTGTKLVETITSYHHPAEYLSRNLLHLPSQETLIDPQRSGLALKRTNYTYDQGTPVTSGAPASVLDTSVSSARGNVTTVTSYRNAADGSGGVSATNIYFDTGQVKESRDANTNPTIMEYDFGLCSATHAVVTNRVRNAKGHTTTTLSDCWSDLALRVTDPNSQSTYNQYDHLGRLVEVAGPGDHLTGLPAIVVGSAPPAGEFRYLRDPAIPNDRVKSGTLVGNNGNGPTSWTDYLELGQVNPLRQRVVTHSKDGTQNGLYIKTFTDGLGRTRQTRTEADSLKSGGAEIVETFVYDAMGRVRETHMPYGVATAADSYEAPPTGSKFTLTEYDALGRVIGVTRPGPLKISTLYEKNPAPSTNEYMVTVIDSKSNKTQTFMDVLDRTLRVARSAPAATCSGGWCVRTMDYDAAGRLLRVLEADGSEQMTFIYDDLGRKKEMTDKDMGTWKYTYDDNGNLIKQIDGKGQIIEMKYDELNRLLRKDLPPTSQNVGPEDTTYFYDGDQP